MYLSNTVTISLSLEVELDSEAHLGKCLKRQTPTWGAGVFDRLEYAIPMPPELPSGSTHTLTHTHTHTQIFTHTLTHPHIYPHIQLLTGWMRVALGNPQKNLHVLCTLRFANFETEFGTAVKKLFF